jgi:hypothetical protein
VTLLSDLSCPWPIDVDACRIADLEYTEPVLIDAVATASSIMTRLSAYTVGLCESQIRPLNMCRSCRTWCCGGADGIYLVGPYGLGVWDVADVRLGATTYDVSTWHFDRTDRMLYRVPPDVWPTKDEKWSPPGTGEAFVVDAVIGTPPDAWALDVATRLVRELVLSCIGAKCRLPSNVTTVSSQGITVRLRDEEVNTFIPELAAWVHAVNPHGARLPGAVFSPEVARGRLSASFSGGGCCGCR